MCFTLKSGVMDPKLILYILGLIALLQFKHFICDGPLQTLAMVQKKSIYGAPLGILHSALHGLGTAFVLIFFAHSIVMLVSLALVDFVVHYHIDYLKENIIKYFRWDVKDAQFWWALNADQTLHQFTYLGLVAILLMA
jgi:Protein of unknown function (DUF3307)